MRRSFYESATRSRDLAGKALKAASSIYMFDFGKFISGEIKILSRTEVSYFQGCACRVTIGLVHGPVASNCLRAFSVHAQIIFTSSGESCAARCMSTYEAS